jgi:hypothetical protein
MTAAELAMVKLLFTRQNWQLAGPRNEMMTGRPRNSARDLRSPPAAGSSSGGAGTPSFPDAITLILNRFATPRFPFIGRPIAGTPSRRTGASRPAPKSGQVA